MSVYNVFLSIAGTLGTLPMPAPGDMWTDINNIAGLRLGNIHTCAAQGFLFDLGIQGFCDWSIILAMYYISSIAFEIPDDMIRKFEPATYLYFACMTLWSTLPSLFNDDYNATYDFPICTSVAKPWFCHEANNVSVDCVRGEAAKSPLFQLPMKLIPYCIIAAITLCTTILSVYMSDKSRCTSEQLKEDMTDHYLLKRRGNCIRTVQNAYSTSAITNTNSNQYESKEEEDHFERTKAILLKAIWYSALWFLSTLSWSLCLYLNRSQERPNLVLMSILLSVGFAQCIILLLIFVIHKVHNLKISNPSISTKEAIWDVFSNGGMHDAIVIMEIDRVTEYQSISHVPDNDEILRQENSARQSPSDCEGVSVMVGSARSHNSKSFTAFQSLEGLSYQRQHATNDNRSDVEQFSTLYSIAEHTSEAPPGSSWDGLSLSYQQSIGVDRSAYGESGLFSIAETTRASERNNAE